MTEDSPAVADAAVLDVAIVSYRCLGLLRACLGSIRDHPAAGATMVYVVDNASDDGTAEMVRAEFPEFALIASDRNLGFAAGTNAAIGLGTAPNVLVLNPDTRLEAGVLDVLLATMVERPEIGICGCRLVREDGSFDHASRRAFPTIAGSLGHFLGVGRTAWAPRRLAQYRAPEVEGGEVDAVNGAFMLIRRAALDEVGLFDEGFWMYMEDLDLCYRFRLAGWKTWYDPSVSVVHVKGGTSGPVRSPKLVYAFHYGMLRFYRKHYADRRSRLTNALVYGGIAAKLGVSLSRSLVHHRRRVREV